MSVVPIFYPAEINSSFHAGNATENFSSSEKLVLGFCDTQCLFSSVIFWRFFWFGLNLFGFCGRVSIAHTVSSLPI